MTLPLHRLNGANGMSDIEGKVTRVGASERGQRTSFNGANGRSMHRRSFLTRLLLGGLAFLVRKNWLVGAEVPKGLIRRVRPSDADWPSAAEWQKLNDAV